jgi:N-acetylglutamate synthase-like GNAT family acetyltransferase
MTVVIARATEADVPAMLSLLLTSGLPSEGLIDHLATAVVARAGASLVATAALELYGEAALLRSVAVADAARRTGIGERITRATLEVAHQRGVRAVYLLTTTAAHFFARHFGFRRIPRDEVPASVRRSVEFTSVCPATADVMVREIDR